MHNPYDIKLPVSVHSYRLWVRPLELAQLAQASDDRPAFCASCHCLSFDMAADDGGFTCSACIAGSPSDGLPEASWHNAESASIPVALDEHRGWVTARQLEYLTSTDGPSFVLCSACGASTNNYYSADDDWPYGSGQWPFAALRHVCFACVLEWQSAGSPEMSHWTPVDAARA